MNPWYDIVTRRIAPRIPNIQPFSFEQNRSGSQYSGPIFQNPVQKAAYIMQALTNPAAFVKQQFPDVPDGILNDPIQVKNYIQQSRGISDQQLQQILNQYPRP